MEASRPWARRGDDQGIADDSLKRTCCSYLRRLAAVVMMHLTDSDRLKRKQSRTPQAGTLEFFAPAPPSKIWPGTSIYQNLGIYRLKITGDSRETKTDGHMIGRSWI